MTIWIGGKAFNKLAHVENQHKAKSLNKVTVTEKAVITSKSKTE